VARAYIEHGLYAKGDLVKLFYFGPMFRYEKPQKGRQRQFHQYGVEALGSLDPAVDAEVIDLAWHLMERVGLSREGLFLRLNSIGCREDRPAYREALRAFFSGRKDELCPDCQRRLEENPLRILDCKEPQCQGAIAQAPKSLDYLCETCRKHFEELLSILRDLGLSYELDPRLVRGIDYYTRTVFELCSRELGAQDALLGGGRYDDLVEMLGGPATPGVGFAGGMERLVLVLSQRAPAQDEAPDLDVFLVPHWRGRKKKGFGNPGQASAAWDCCGFGLHGPFASEGHECCWPPRPLRPHPRPGRAFPKRREPKKFAHRPGFPGRPPRIPKPPQGFPEPIKRSPCARFGPSLPKRRRAQGPEKIPSLDGRGSKEA
jgi:histidyl-tRNA synthetase